MEIFELNKIILKEVIDKKTWEFRVDEVINPSREEIERNKEFNDSLGNYEPEHVELLRSTTPLIKLVAESSEGEVISLWWDPCIKKVGPPISKKGWSKGLFTKINGKLANWKFST